MPALPMTSIGTIVGATPCIVRAANGYDLAVPDDAKVFLVTRNPCSAPMLGPAAFKQFVEQARQHDWPVFQVGRSIVYVLNRAWDSPALVQELVTVLVDSQHQRIPGSEPERAGARIRRRLRAWARALFEPANAPASPLPAPPLQPIADDRRAAALQPPVAASAAAEPDTGDQV
jgi:hypothetical protein